MGHRTPWATPERLVATMGAWAANMTQTPLARKPSEPSRAAVAARHDQAQPAFASLARRLRDDALRDARFTDHVGAEQACGAAVVHILPHSKEHRPEFPRFPTRPGVDESPEVDHALRAHVRRQEATRERAVSSTGRIMRGFFRALASPRQPYLAPSRSSAP